MTARDAHQPKCPRDLHDTRVREPHKDEDHALDDAALVPERAQGMVHVVLLEQVEEQRVPVARPDEVVARDRSSVLPCAGDGGEKPSIGSLALRGGTRAHMPTNTGEVNQPAT